MHHRLALNDDNDGCGRHGEPYDEMHICEFYTPF